MQVPPSDATIWRTAHTQSCPLHIRLLCILLNNYKSHTCVIQVSLLPIKVSPIASQFVVFQVPTSDVTMTQRVLADGANVEHRVNPSSLPPSLPACLPPSLPNPRPEALNPIPQTSKPHLSPLTLHPSTSNRHQQPQNAIPSTLNAQPGCGVRTHPAHRRCVTPPPQFKNNFSAEMWSGSEEGSYLRLIDGCITQL